MSGGRLVILAGGVSSRMKNSVVAQVIEDTSLMTDADRKAKSMIGVGNNHGPFLDYLLYNAREAGYKDVLIIIGERDDSIREYYGMSDRDNEFHGLRISYAVQKIPAGRDKPLGTADALLQGLNCMTEWRSARVTVCNSDNLYSEKALRLMLRHEHENAMVDYDRDALQFDQNRIERFAVTSKDKDGFLTGIIEKPSEEQIEAVRGKDGYVGVSMNIFDLQYEMVSPFLESVPLNPARREKELPEAIALMIKALPKSVFAYPLAEHVPDLTVKGDIPVVKKYLESHFGERLF